MTTLHDRALDLLQLVVTSQGEARAQACAHALDLLDEIRAVPPECRSCPCYANCDDGCVHAPARTHALQHDRHKGAA